MTTAAEPPPVSRRQPTFIVPLLTLIIAGLLVWHFGVFKGKPTLALVTSGDTPYWDRVIAGANEAAKVYDVKLTVVRSKTDTDEQMQSIRELLKTKFDGIAISPVNPVAQASVLADVSTNSTLVTVDSDSPISNRLCFVGTDNYHAGRLAGEQVKRALPDGGEVIICLGATDKANTQHRRQGLIDELLDREYEEDRAADPYDAPLRGSKYTIVATLVDGSDAALAEELAGKALSEHPNVKCFVGLLAYSTPAILQALEKAQKLGAVKVVGFDAQPATLNGIANGHASATIMQDQYGFGYHAVRILAENARGDSSGLPMFQRRTLPCEVVTADNVSSVQAQLAGGDRPRAGS